ncbi:MAG: hypothetical protein ABW210_01635, partial [Achromobacter sp.]
WSRLVPARLETEAFGVIRTDTGEAHRLSLVAGLYPQGLGKSTPIRVQNTLVAQHFLACGAPENHAESVWIQGHPLLCARSRKLQFDDAWMEV